MDSEERARARECLEGRQEAIARAWYRAIARTGYVSFRSDQIIDRLTELAGEIVTILLAESLDTEAAEAIGEAVAGLHYLQPEVLGQTQEILAQELMQGLSSTLRQDLQPDLGRLLSHLAIGFGRQSQKTILAEQEAVRDALLTQLQETERALRRAHDELEDRVRSRTLQLARSNKELRIEIRERKRIEAALQESEERWRSLVENAPDVILIVDRVGRILFANRSSAGVEEGFVRGKSILEYVTPDHHDRVWDSLQRVSQTGKPDSYEVLVRLFSGERRWYSVRSGPIGRDGEVDAVVLISRDITGRKEIEELKDNLIRDVSHELRTPLAKIQMSLEYLQELIEKEEIDRQRLARIGSMSSRSIRRLLETVESILDLSTLEARTVAYDRELLQVMDLIHAVCYEMEPLAQAKDLELRADLPRGLSEIRGDWEKLFRVLTNLIDNAIKFSDEGEIVVSADDQGNEIEISVRDSGQGIDQDNVRMIFERFYQEKARFPGLGVGLAICKTIVEAHDGRIWAESPGRGKGATLRFTLPVAGSKEGDNTQSAGGGS